MRLAFPWEFFSAAVFECAKYTRGAAASLPPRLHPHHLIFLVSLQRVALPLSLLYQKKKKNEKREIKKNAHATFLGHNPIRLTWLFRRWLNANQIVAGWDFFCLFSYRLFLLAEIKQIIGSNLADLFDYCSDLSVPDAD